MFALLVAKSEGQASDPALRRRRLLEVVRPVRRPGGGQEHQVQKWSYIIKKSLGTNEQNLPH